MRSEIGFNVNYLLDALAAIDAGKVELGLTDANSSCLVSASPAPRVASTSSCRCGSEAGRASSRLLHVTRECASRICPLHPNRQRSSSRSRAQLIVGENGAGKTILLEAIYLLGARPFVSDAQRERLSATLKPSLARIRADWTTRAPSRRHRDTADGGTRARIGGAVRFVACRDRPGCFPSRPSIPVSTSSSRKVRSAAGDGSTGWCSTWNLSSSVSGAATTGRFKQRNAALRVGGRRATRHGIGSCVQNGVTDHRARQ